MVGSSLHAADVMSIPGWFLALQVGRQQLGLFNALLQDAGGTDVICLQHEGLHASMVKLHFQIA